MERGSRMPSRVSNILQAAIRGFRPLLNNLSLEMERMGQDLLAEADTRALPENMVVANDCVGHVLAEWVHTLGAPEDEAILYFHGGAYMAGTIASTRPLAVDFAQATGRNVLSFEYRLAPENPYPAALEDAMAIYRHVLSLGIAANRIAFVGDSAGGGLEIATALKAREEALPLPAAIVALSPWADLTLSDESYVENKSVDPLLERRKLLRAVMFYAYGKSLMDPLISPVFADFTGFPPTMIHVGTHEVLLGDSRKLYAAMKRDGVDAELLEWEGMWHVFQVFDVPESRAAIERIAEFMLKNISPGLAPGV